VPDIPQAAITAAAAAIGRKMHPGDVFTMTAGSDEALARIALEAAVPALAEHVAARITAHADRQFPKTDPAKAPGRPDLWRTWHRHFRIAAQVAALAFTTEDELKRTAAEALATGNYVACPDQEQATCKHCGKPIERCGPPPGQTVHSYPLCKGWRHVGLDSQPIMGHCCDGRMINPAAEPEEAAP